MTVLAAVIVPLTPAVVPTLYDDALIGQYALSFANLKSIPVPFLLIAGNDALVPPSCILLKFASVASVKRKIPSPSAVINDLFVASPVDICN